MQVDIVGRLKSRKLWVAIGSVLSILITQFIGVELDPAALGSIAAVAASYVLGQGLVDRNVTSEQIKVAGDMGRTQVELYARNLEQQLAQLMQEKEGVPDNVSPLFPEEG